MKSILLTTTALVAFAGAAAADGHISVTWSGTATAGVAREGGSDATGTAVDALTSILLEGDVEDPLNAGTALTEAEIRAALAANVAQDLLLEAASGSDIATVIADAAAETPARTLTEAEARAELIASTRKLFATNLAVALDDVTLTAAERKALQDLYDGQVATGNAFFGTLAKDTGDFEEYAEVNATVVGSVALDSGVTLSASMSVDAGRGYDFADDDGFDAAKTNGVGFDNVTVDAGAYGTLKLAPNDIAHLVDDDDDASADFLYTNDFGVASVSFAMDIDEDSDVEARDASWELLTVAEGANVDDMAQPIVLGAASNTDGDSLNLWFNPAIAADVQWSAKVEAPVADIATVYAAIDEEGGYDVGGSATVAGLTINAKVKNEALGVAEGDDAEFAISGSYTMSGLTVGAGWSSIEDGDQWSINGSYTMDAITVSASTDEGEDWEVTGSYDLGSGASIVAGVNYTEDAYVGVSFKF